MRIKLKYVKKYYNFLTEMSVFDYLEDYPIQGDRKLDKWKTFFDVLMCKIKYGMKTKEYFFYSFYNKSSYARKSFISEMESTYLMAFKIRKLGKVCFSDKFDTYLAYKNYFNRDVIKVKLPDEKQEFESFCKKHTHFIMKPVSGTQGKGIIVGNVGDSHIIDRCVPGDYVVEEYIEQDHIMASYHPSSVNTIRYATYYSDGKLQRLFAILRIGVGHSSVDNTHAGGIGAAIDLDTGIIVSAACGHDGRRHYFHPDTGVQIIGSKIPKWKELNRMIDEIVLVNPSIRLVGWDFALSTKGWCLIEGNTGPSLMGIQGGANIGFRKRIKELC